jgi:hypothetical protein
MRHRHVFHHYAPCIAEVPECTISELNPHVCNDAVGEAKVVYKLIKELDCFF